MDYRTIQTLATAAADIAAIDGDNVISVEMGEMADGSRRHYALVRTDAAGLEQLYRATTEAPADAPAWARKLEAAIEVNVGAEGTISGTGGTWLRIDA